MNKAKQKITGGVVIMSGFGAAIQLEAIKNAVFSIADALRKRKIDDWIIWDCICGALEISREEAEKILDEVRDDITASASNKIDNTSAEVTEGMESYAIIEALFGLVSVSRIKEILGKIYNYNELGVDLLMMDATKRMLIDNGHLIGAMLMTIEMRKHHVSDADQMAALTETNYFDDSDVRDIHYKADDYQKTPEKLSELKTKLFKN